MPVRANSSNVSDALGKLIVATLLNSYNKESALKRKHTSGCTQQDVYIISCITLTHAITRHHYRRYIHIRCDRERNYY